LLQAYCPKRNAANLSTSKCFGIFELIKFVRFDSTLSYPHKEFLNPRPPRTKYNPRGLTRPAQHFSAQYHVEYEQWSIEVCGWTA